MAIDVRIIRGPSSTRISKEEATTKLAAHPELPKGATFELEEVEGRWVAAVASERIEKKAEFPPTDDAPSGPPSPDGPPSDEDQSDFTDSEDKPSEEDDKKPKGDKKEEKGGDLKQIEHMLTTLLTALGIPPEGALDNPVPGADEGPPAPPGGPEGGPPTDSEGKTHTVHERALKPGEAPPGSTPVGAPAFASVRDDHPWKSVAGVKRTFTVQEPIGDTSLTAIRDELKVLASEIPEYEIKRLREDVVDGQRVARAIIARRA